MKMRNYLATAMLFCAGLINSGYAQVQNWQAGPAESDFGDFTNWTFVVPHENTIAAIGPHPNAENSQVLLDQNRTIGAILITDGMFLRNNGHRLTVNNLNAGGLTVAGSNSPGGLLRRSSLILNGVGGGLALDMNGSLRIVSGGQLELNNSPVDIEGDFVIGPESQLVGWGTGSMRMNHADLGGAIHATAGAEILLDAQSYDLDGPNNHSIFNAIAPEAKIRLEHSETLAVDDPLDGRILIGPDSTFELRHDPISDDQSQMVWLGQVQMEMVGSQNQQAVFRSDTQVRTHADLSADHLGLDHGLVEIDVTAAALIDAYTMNAHVDIELQDNSRLDFGETILGLMGRIDVGDGATLLLNSGSVYETELVINGGTIVGDAALHINHPEGLQGNGTVEMPILRNEEWIRAQGGDLVVDGTGGSTLWEGYTGEGRLFADNGNMHVIDDETIDMGPATVMSVGFKRELQFESPFVVLQGSVDMDGGTLIADNELTFDGEMDVFENSFIQANTFFGPSAEVELHNADLTLRGPEADIFTGTNAFGTGRLINQVEGVLSLFPVSIDVAFENQSAMRFDNSLPQPYTASFGNGMKNSGLIRFRIFDDNESDLINIEGNLSATGGVFEVVSQAQTLELGDEFQVLDVTGEFDAESYTLELPELPQGLFWDRSDFESEGVIRVVDFLLGDVNQDGTVDLLDVAPFVVLITGGDFQIEGDINMDGEVNLLDVAEFVELITG